MSQTSQAYYGLPQEVEFCRRCVVSNQRPSSYPEFRHTKDRQTPTLHIDDEGVCDACRYAELKEQIVWEDRERELGKLLDEYRREDGHYDCIVPGSGGKDSVYATKILKEKYGMHPLTVTWPPLLYTEYGWQNFRNWIEVGGVDNVTFKPNGRVHCLLTRLAIENLLHPFQTFILGQKHIGPRTALQYNVPLVFYGESEAEYGNPIAETNTSLRDHSYYTMNDLDQVYLGGVSIPELREKHHLSLNDLSPYLPPTPDELTDADVQVHYLGYYLKWTPQEAFYEAVEYAGFRPRPFRSEGTYSKYASVDDKVDDLHWYTTFIKFGIGRTTHDASQEIRNRHLDREEAVALVQQYDGEFPGTYLADVLEYLEIDTEHFASLCDDARSPHLWKQESGEWVLRHCVS